MSWIASFRTATLFTWTRVRRSWWLPAAAAGGLATGLVTVTQTVAETGAGVLQQAAQFLAFLQVGVMVLAGLAADPERDEDSAAVLWSWPVDKAALVLGRFAGTAPLALLAALAAVLPPAVRIAMLLREAGMGWPHLLAEWGLLAAGIVAGALWAAALGVALGLWLRGLGLFAALLATWLAGVLGPYVLQALFNLFFPLAWLAQWTGSGMLPADFRDVDLVGISEDLPLYLMHRAFYFAAGLAVCGGVALCYRRRRGVAPRPGRWLGWATAVAAGMAVAAGAGLGLQLYGRADAARQELLYYARQGVPAEGEALEPDPAPPYVVSRYDLDLDLRRAPEVRAQVELQLENPGSRPVRDPVLTLRHVFTIEKLEVRASGGGNVQGRRQGDWIRLEGLVLPPGGAVTVSLRYHGRVDQWILPDGYPLRRGLYAEVPAPWRGAHTGRTGTYLPVSYGWYPLPGRVTLARALRLTDPATGGASLWLDEGPALASNGTVRWPGSRPPVVDGDPASFEPAPAAFRITVRHPGHYPVLSNLNAIHRPWGPETTMEGSTTFVHLVGRPLARYEAAGAEIWYPQEHPGSLVRARRWAGWLKQARALVGETSTSRIITLPSQGTARINRLFVDPATGVVLEAGDAILVPQQAVEAVLFGSREVATEAEACLGHAVTSRILRAQEPAAASPPQPGEQEGPCASLAGSPAPDFVERWVAEAPQRQLAVALDKLRQRAAQRPLEPRDLWEVMGP